MRKLSVTALVVAGMLLLQAPGVYADQGSAAKQTGFTKDAYVHGDEGYYNITEEYPGFEMRLQEEGTCWLHSASAGMETAYARQNGHYVSIDPDDLLGIIYGNDKLEGFFIRPGEDAAELGGWQWMVTETLSRGFGELTLDSSVILDPNEREAIKEAVLTRGGVSIVVPDNSTKRGLHHGYYTMNDTKSNESDHEVTVLGWDDSFPKEYFNEQAERDGAWICHNGASGMNIFYYVSYCTPITQAISQSATDKYSCVFSYDAGNEQDLYLQTGAGTTVANVFHREGTLAAIGTYNDFDTQEIRIDVYDSTFTALLCSQEAVLSYHGYHTVALETPVAVSDFAIAVTYSEGAPVEGETIDYGPAEYRTVCESGQSFILQDDGWRDLADSSLAAELGIGFQPGNCCIKALMR